MKHFLRSSPKQSSSNFRHAGYVAGILLASMASPAILQAQLLTILPSGMTGMVRLQPGYLGIDMHDLDSDRAAALRLKTGVEVTVVDHDAPAGKAGLRAHDVIQQANGQAVADCDQLRKLLRDIPAGGSVSFLVLRDGQKLSFNVQLVDRDTLAQDSWSGHMAVPVPDDDDSSQYPLVPPSGGKIAGSSGFFGVLSFGAPSVGVELDPLGSQLADYFGVHDGQGMLVKRVAVNSPAASAGLHAGDVVTRVNGNSIPTLNAWEKAIRANKGKDVQVTIVRNRREQTLNLQAGGPKHKG